MAALHTHILDVRPAGLGDLQPVQAQQDGPGDMGEMKRSAVNSSRATSQRSRPGPSDRRNQQSELATGLRSSHRAAGYGGARRGYLGRYRIGGTGPSVRERGDVILVT